MYRSSETKPGFSCVVYFVSVFEGFLSHLVAVELK